MTYLRLMLALACTVAAVRPVVAQGWDMPWSDPRDRPPRVDLSLSTGWLMSTDWSDLVLLGSISPVTGVLEQVLVRDVRVEPANGVAGSLTYWRGRYGFRVHAERSSSTLLLGSSDIAGGIGNVDLNTWIYDVRGAIGLLEYSPTRWALPYVFIGLGGITYDLADTVSPPLLSFIERAPPGPSARVVIDDGGRQFLLAVDELGLESVFAGSFGIGTDLRIPLGASAVGLRFEVSDHVAPSPLRVRIHELGRFAPLSAHTNVGFGWVHHLRASVGVVLQIGR